MIRNMRIAELFYSIQGEGKLMGMPSVFIRVSGCNLRCTWCDTPYASWNPEGPDEKVGDIISRVGAFGARHVVITGGEPLIMAELAELCEELKKRNHNITIETAATIFKPVKVDLASLSPKLSNSTPSEREGGRFAEAHERNRLDVSVIQQFIDSSPDFQLKFVVSAPEDLVEIRDLLKQLKGWTPDHVLLMPEGIDREALEARSKWIVEICQKEGYRFCPRLHILLFGNRRGT